MFGPRSNQSPESMMFGSNKLERGIIFVTVYVTTTVKYLIRVGRSKIPQNHLTSYVNAPFLDDQLISLDDPTDQQKTQFFVT